MDSIDYITDYHEGSFPARGSRSVCGTLNNPTDEEIAAAMNHSLPLYICGAIEFAPSTGTRHWQFYIAFENCIRLSTLKQIMPRAHFRACKGDAEQNIAYVKKSRPVDIANMVDNNSNMQTFQERGSPPSTTKRLQGIAYVILTMSELALEYASDECEWAYELLDFLSQLETDLYDLQHDLAPELCTCDE